VDGYLLGRGGDLPHAKFIGGGQCQDLSGLGGNNASVLALESFTLYYLNFSGKVNWSPIEHTYNEYVWS
jgi:hypothetical protein